MTSRAPGGRACWPTSRGGCAASRMTSRSSSRSRRSWRRWAAPARVDRGLQVVPLDAIVGTVDRAADFDRGFRPTTTRLRSRWERIAAAQRRGEALPPISLFQVGELYFVRDGHHRVSVAKSLGRDGHRRLCDRGQDPAAAGRATCGSPSCRSRTTSGCSASASRWTASGGPIALSDPWDFGTLAEMVEAWGFRMMQERGHSCRPPRGRPALVRRGVHAGRRRCSSRRRADRARGDPGGRLHARGRRSATCCCARTSGRTRCSTACAAPPSAQATRLPPKRRRRKYFPPLLCDLPSLPPLPPPPPPPHPRPGE